MTEWTIVSVLAVLVGLLVSILKPIINLTRELSRLTTEVTELEKKVESLTAKSSDGRQRIWNHIEEQDGRISTCEKKIGVLESKHERKD